MKMPTTTAATAIALPRLYLGTMTFGWSQTSNKVTEDVALAMVQTFAAHNERHDEQCHRIDTARIYAGGKTEPMVGAVLGKIDNHERYRVGTKAHPSQDGGLSPQGLQQQLAASLDAMQDASSSPLQPLAEYYLHQPDPEHSLLESLQTLHTMIEQGQISSIGMSNYHAFEMQRCFELCRQHGLTPPTVYQGLYNPLNRAVEDELLPVLRAHNCSFVAYNPLAAGLLAGKYTSLDNVPKGRFKNNANYLPRFYTATNFQAVAHLQQACARHGLTLIEATYRWLLCHSALRHNDGVLLGASSVPQLEQNLAACAQAANPIPLSAAMLQAFDAAWAMTRADGVFPYWRSYSADMPQRDALDPGAAYDANKK